MVLGQLAYPVTERQADIHLRVGGEEGSDDRQHMKASENDRRGDDQFPRRRTVFAAGDAFGLSDLVENAAAGSEIGVACVGQRQPARRAVQQTCLEMPFQIGDLAADGCKWNARTACGGGKATGLHRRDEKGHGLEAIHHFFRNLEG